MPKHPSNLHVEPTDGRTFSIHSSIVATIKSSLRLPQLSAGSPQVNYTALASARQRVSAHLLRLEAQRQMPERGCYDRRQSLTARGLLSVCRTRTHFGG